MGTPFALLACFAIVVIFFVALIPMEHDICVLKHQVAHLSHHRIPKCKP